MEWHWKTMIGLIFLTLTLGLIADLTSADFDSVDATLLASDRNRGVGLEQFLLRRVKFQESPMDSGTEHQFLMASQGTRFLMWVTSGRIQSQVYFFDGEELWFSRGGLSRPLKISQRQRAFGDASIADVVGSFFLRDFTTAEIIGFNEKDVRRIKMTPKEARRTLYGSLMVELSVGSGLVASISLYSKGERLMRRYSFKYDLVLPVEPNDIPFISSVEVSGNDGSISGAGLFGAPLIVSPAPVGLKKEIMSDHGLFELLEGLIQKVE